MKRYLILFLLALPAFGQTNIRWDWQANTVTGTGQMLPVLALPGAYVNFYTGCTTLPCVTSAVTYAGATGATTCPASAAVTWQPPTLTGCHATADSQGNFGGWFQAGAYQYVITVSGHQSGPYNFNVGGGGGSGGVSIVSCTDPDPIFGCSVSNPSTAPAISFPLKNQAANTIFGNFTGTSGPPFFAVFTCTGLLTCTYDSGTNTWNVDIPTASSLSITSTDPILVNGAHGPVSSGTANISCDPNGCGTPILPFLAPPSTAQHIVLYPTTATLTTSGACTQIATFPAFPVVDNNSALLGLIPQASAFPPSTCQVIWGFAGALAAQHPEVIPANITSAYGTGITSWVQGVGSPTITVAPGGGSFGPSASQPSWPLQQSTSGVTGITGANIETATITALLSRSGTSSGVQSEFAINSPALFVYFTGPAPTSSSAIYLAPPLTKSIDAFGNQVIGVDPVFPQYLVPQTLAQALAFRNPTGSAGYVISITDGANATDCTVGGGTTAVLCQSNGTAYVAVGGSGGGSGTYFTEVVTCASTCTLAHTPATFDNFSVNGLVMVDGTDFTRSGTTVTLSVPAVGGDVYYAQYHY